MVGAKNKLVRKPQTTHYKRNKLYMKTASFFKTAAAFAFAFAACSCATTDTPEQTGVSNNLVEGVPSLLEDGLSSPCERVASVLKYAAGRNLALLPDGEYTFDGGNVVMIIKTVSLQDASDAKLEAHRKYADLVVALACSEKMALKDVGECSKDSAPYDAAKDIVFYSDAPSETITLDKGYVVLLPPSIVHAPSIGSGVQKKAIFKIRVD